MMQLLPSFLHTYPSIPELDFFGTIAAVGSSVPASRGLVPGANVFGSVPVPQHLRGAGALAEYVALEAGTVALAPGKATAEEAAGLPVSGCSALALMKAAKLERGMKVLVNGASGGVGSLVVQMAKNAVGPEGKVVAMCSGTNADLVKSLGADEVVDYQAHAPVHKFLAGTYVEDKFDVVIDAYGVQDFFAHSAGYLKPRKQFVTVGIAFAEYTTSSLLYAVGQMMKNALLPSWLGGVNRPYAQITGMATLEGLESLRDMVENGQLRGVVDGVWEMENVLEVSCLNWTWSRTRILTSF